MSAFCFHRRKFRKIPIFSLNGFDILIILLSRCSFLSNLSLCFFVSCSISYDVNRLNLCSCAGLGSGSNAPGNCLDLRAIPPCLLF